MGERLKKKWVLAERIPDESARALSIYPFPFRQVLFNRGISNLEEAANYLGAESPIFDPFLLSGMEAAVGRIRDAILGREKIAVYGDYDVDGVTATVLLVEVIRALGGDPQEYIPNRFDEGYGLNCDAMDTLSTLDVKLVVTVDCGIRSPKEAEYARTLGMDMIISDHHFPQGQVPTALAVICPKQEGDAYPNKDISGVGLAYKIADALIQKFPEKGLQPENWLDLVALGTVADVVPLTGENRVLVRKGLDLIHTGKRLGIRTLANIAGVNIQQVNSTDIGFKLGPRLNAAGRLESALDSFDLLITESSTTAAEKARKLDALNQDRQSQTVKSQQIAEGIARQSENGMILFAAHEEFSEGIVGLVASKLTEAHYRPSIAGRIQEETIRASCRSIPEFHITNALDECADLLVRHGGHAMAAGFTVRSENLEPFLERLFGIAERALSNLDLTPTIKIDCEVPLKDLNRELLLYLDKLNPIGAQNPGAVLLSRSLTVLEARRMGVDGKHLRMRVKQNGPAMSAVAFGFGDWLERNVEKVDLAYRLEMNEYNGFQSLQMNVVDIHESFN